MPKEIEIIETMNGAGKKKRRILYKERKYTIPKIRIERGTNRKYFFLKKKKIYMEDDISERQLIKFIISQLAPNKRKRPKKEKREPVFPKAPVVPMTITGSQFVGPNGARDTKIADLKEEVQNLKLLAVDKKKVENEIKPPPQRIKSSDLSFSELKKEFKRLRINKPEIAQICSDRFGEAKSKWAVFPVDDLVQKLADDGYKPENVKIEEVKEKEVSEEEEDNLKRIQKVNAMSTDELQKTLKKMKIDDENLNDQQMKNIILREQFGTDQIPIPDDAYYQVGDGKIRKRESEVDEKGLDTLQIDEIMKPYKEFLGTIPSDGIPSLISQVKPNTRICFIMNSDPTGEPGSHWVAVLVDNRKDGSHSIEFYNPLGIRDRRRLTSSFLTDIVPLLEKINPEERPLKLKENLIADQNNTSNNCGQFSIRFLLDRLTRNKTFAEATGYDEKGEAMIEKFKDDFYPFRLITQNGTGLLSALKKGYKYVKGKVVPIVKVIGKALLETAKERAKDVIENGLRKELPPSGRSVLAKHGNEPIQEIMVCRVPIKSWLSKALDWVSSGQFSQNLKSLNYDSAFHLFMKIRTSDGAYLTEKNEVIKLKSEGWNSGDGAKSDTEKMIIPLSGGIRPSLDTLFESAFKKYGTERITRYDSRNNNCQQYVSDLLTASGLMTDGVKKFVMQDAEAIYKNMGIIGTVNRAITDAAAAGDHILNGRGKGQSKR
jgi:hypothetical protein